jgi:hypothetical protein
MVTPCQHRQGLALAHFAVKITTAPSKSLAENLLKDRSVTLEAQRLLIVAGSQQQLPNMEKRRSTRLRHK